MRAKAAIFASFAALLLAVCAGQRLQAQNSSAAPASGASFQDSTNELAVSVGKTVLVDTAQPIAHVAVGLGDIAVVSAVNPTEIMVDGKSAGETSLIIWDIHGGRQLFNVSVRPSTAASDNGLEAIRRELRAELPDQSIKISMENGNVFLRGTVNNLNSSERAVKIAATGTGQGGKVINLLSVKVPDSEPQILLKVRFASVDRTLERQLGINLFNTGFGNVLGTVSTGQFSPGSVLPGPAGAQPGAVGNDLNIMGFLPGQNVGGTLEALETKGVLEELAQPNLLAANGKQASFLAGGEFPYPVVQGTSSGSAAVSIMFKEYGIRLNFIPTITPRGTIRLQLAPEVSALDYTHEVQVSGFTVPGITTRNVNTEVELEDRQSFVIGGLLDNSVTETFEKIPFLGDVPILGKFFQSVQRTKNNTELIVIVTPEIVAPISAGAPLPELSYPIPFLPPNSKTPMHTPDALAATAPPSPTTIPVEKLIQSMQPEQPLVIQGATGQFGAAGGTLNSGGPAPAPQQ